MLGQVLRSLLRREAAVAATAATAGAIQQPPVPAAAKAHAPLPMMDALAQRVAAGLQQSVGSNYDAERWGDENGPRALEAARNVSEQCLATLLQWPAEFQSAFERFADDASRELFLDLLAYRMAGHRHCRLPLDAPRHWAHRARAAALSIGPSPISGPFGPMSRFLVEFGGESISLDAYPGNVAWTFLIGQYYFSRGTTAVAPRAGDIVIDAGACFADTALAFAASAGRDGHVYAFEIDAGNLLVARFNLAANPGLAPRIELLDQALGRECGTLYLHGSGPGAKVSTEPSAHPVQVTTLDTFVGQAGLARVDFLKMDIEGAEFDALLGARETLRRWRPRLALSVYHHVADLARIANWLAGLDLGYRLFLDHYTIHHEEAVLYALPPDSPLH